MPDDINRNRARHFRESGNPEIPPQAGWIPPVQVRGRLCQARNDKRQKIYAVLLLFYVWQILESFFQISEKQIPLMSTELTKSSGGVKK
jgi:hypothetical protein